MSLQLYPTSSLSPWFNRDSWFLSDPFEDLDIIHRRPSNLFKRFSTFDKELSPLMSADLIETEKDYQIHCDLPGVNNEDLDLSFSNGFLTLKAERKSSNEKKTDTGHSIERSFGKVQRRIAIPSSADTEKVEATFKNGVLTVFLPKKAEAATQRKIEINNQNV